MLLVSCIFKASFQACSSKAACKFAQQRWLAGWLSSGFLIQHIDAAFEGEFVLHNAPLHNLPPLPASGMHFWEIAAAGHPQEGQGSSSSSSVWTQSQDVSPFNPNRHYDMGDRMRFPFRNEEELERFLATYYSSYLGHQ